MPPYTRVSVSLSHGGQGECLVPPYTRGSVSLYLYIADAITTVDEDTLDALDDPARGGEGRGMELRGPGACLSGGRGTLVGHGQVRLPRTTAHAALLIRIRFAPKLYCPPGLG